MAISPSAFYYNAQTFSLATDVWLDANLTNPAPDGFYATAGIYRQKSGGVLGAPQRCEICSVGCSDIIGGGGVNIINHSVKGKYKIIVDVGTATGAINIIFNPGVSSPAKCQWTYDGITASEYTNSLHGYLQGLVGIVNAGVLCSNNNTPASAPISNTNGSNGLSYPVDEYLYDNANSVFQDSGLDVNIGPYTNQASGGVSLVAGSLVGNCLMVAPKLNPSPSTIELIIEVPCMLGSNWSVVINCPQSLTEFDRAGIGGNCSPMTAKAYTASPFDITGKMSTLLINDFIFSDPNGLVPLPAGVYPITDGGSVSCVTVSSNGIITNMAACSGSC